MALTNSIFQEPWWLDAVAPGSWDEVTVEKGGQVVGRLPFVIEESRFGVQISMPKFTQTLGPVVDCGDGRLTVRLANHKKITTQLIESLPHFDQFSQKFHHSVENWLPWHWKGFRQTTRYSYVLSDLEDETKLWEGLAGNIRTDIKKARQVVSMEAEPELEEFLDLNEMSFGRQGRKPPFTRDQVRQLDKVCRERERRKIFIAKDQEGRAHAGAYVVWDDRTAYYLIGGGNPALRNSGATSFCLWSAICFAATVTKSFDFEGSMVEPIEKHFRGFGGQAMAYHSVRRENSRGMLMRLGKGLQKRISSRLSRSANRA